MQKPPDPLWMPQKKNRTVVNDKFYLKLTIILYYCSSFILSTTYFAKGNVQLLSQVTFQLVLQLILLFILLILIKLIILQHKMIRKNF